MWCVPNVKETIQRKRFIHASSPIAVVERCVLALTNENDWVLDPFSGVGSAYPCGFATQPERDRLRKGAGIHRNGKAANRRLPQRDAAVQATGKTSAPADRARES